MQVKEGCFVLCRIFCTIHTLSNSLTRDPHYHNESRLKYIGCSKATECESLIQPEVVFCGTFSGFCRHPGGAPRNFTQDGGASPGRAGGAWGREGRGFSGPNPLNASSMLSWPSSDGLELLEPVRVGKGIELSQQCVYP